MKARIFTALFIAVIAAPLSRGTEHVSVVVRSDTHGFSCFSPENVTAGEISVTMQPSIRANGTVVGADGRPVPNATIKVRYRDTDNCRIRFENLSEEQLTTARGEFTLFHVDVAHDFDIVVSHSEHGSLVVGKFDLLGAQLTDGVRRLELRMDQ